MHSFDFVFHFFSLFSNCLGKVTTWLEIKNWLMPDGRIMVNCGGSVDDLDNSSSNASSVQNYTIKALSKAFPGQVGLSYPIKILFYYISVLAISYEYLDST